MTEMSTRSKEKDHRTGKQLHTCRGQKVLSHQCPAPTASLPTTGKLDRPLEQEWEC